MKPLFSLVHLWTFSFQNRKVSVLRGFHAVTLYAHCGISQPLTCMLGKEVFQRVIKILFQWMTVFQVSSLTLNIPRNLASLWTSVWNNSGISRTGQEFTVTFHSSLMIHKLQILSSCSVVPTTSLWYSARAPWYNGSLEGSRTQGYLELTKVQSHSAITSSSFLLIV